MSNIPIISGKAMPINNNPSQQVVYADGNECTFTDVYIDTNNNGVQDEKEPTASATVLHCLLDSSLMARHGLPDVPVLVHQQGVPNNIKVIGLLNLPKPAPGKVHADLRHRGRIQGNTITAQQRLDIIYQTLKDSDAKLNQYVGNKNLLQELWKQDKNSIRMHAARITKPAIIQSNMPQDEKGEAIDLVDKTVNNKILTFHSATTSINTQSTIVGGNSGTLFFTQGGGQGVASTQNSIVSGVPGDDARRNIGNTLSQQGYY